MAGGAVTLLQVNSLELVGGDRTVELGPGLNIVVGPIATGKSTLVSLLRALFGASPTMPVEVEENVSSLRAEVTVGTDTIHLMRRLVTTDTALVEIVDGEEAMLLPAKRPTATRDLTYASWLLQKLGLPEIEVPAAPTRADSAPTAVSVTDYLNYSFLRGDEIDNSVFGNTNPYRDIKRKYVFEIVYGLYDEKVAGLQAELRAIENELGYLRGERAATSRIFEGTELESIEAVRVALFDRETQLDIVRRQEAEIAQAAADSLGTSQLREDIEQASATIAAEREGLAAIRSQIEDLYALDQQLRSQQARIVRALIAEEVLVDFEFLVCPRCGQDLEAARAESDMCNLCLQPEPQHRHVDSLEAERERLEEQIEETAGVLEGRGTERAAREKQIQRAIAHRDQLAGELDRVTGAFVSDRQRTIEAAAGLRATLAAEIVKYQAYLTILERSEASEARITSLGARREKVREELDEVTTRLRRGQNNVAALTKRFDEYVRRLEIPSFGEELTATLDSKTYLPIVSDRPFARLSSQGLQVLVNLAHALAHHTVAIDRGLALPGLLVIDGPSSNVGTEGFDTQRLEDAYTLLAAVAAEYASDLQLIVVDNNIPAIAKDWIRLRLEEDDRLVRGIGVRAELDGH